MNSFGQRLKALRKESGVSQSYVADHIGVSTQSVSNWECDNTMPDISQIVPLAALLSVSTDYCLHFHFISKTFAAAFIETSPIKNMRERLAFSEGQCYNG